MGAGRFLTIFFLVAVSFFARAQQLLTVSGNVTDSSSGESLAGAVISIEGISMPVMTNAYGFYSFSLPAGIYQLTVRFIGYEIKNLTLQLHDNQVFDISLSETGYNLERIDVRGDRSDHNVSSTDMGVVKISPKQIENIPVFFGEHDLIKTIQMMPGIKSAGDGNTGFYVRGGGIDQNLVILDEATVYNTSHLLGFFSVFNSEAIRDAELMKGVIPAEYGGRASSVLDIRMKDGNMNDTHVTGNVGLISSNITAEGPIKKEKSSFMFSARRTYADLFLNFSGDEDLRTTNLYFYDLNLKTNFRINAHNRLYLSGYLGRDDFLLPGRFGFDWGSKTATVRWNHTFGEKLFSNTSMIYSNYSYQINIMEDTNVKIRSIIRDFNLKQDFALYQATNKTLKFGLNLIFHNIVPGEIKANPNSVYNSLELKDRKAIESSLYISQSLPLCDRLKMYYGLRLSLFANVGPGDFYQFDENGELLTTTTYDSFHWVKTQGGPEPRLSFNYLLGKESSLKASYNRVYQFLHLLSNSISSTPTDLWLPSSNNVKPQLCDQLSAGYFRNMKENRYEMSAEVYYKWLQNQIDYKNGADLVYNSTVEAELVFGRGWAYGAEFFFRKNYGRLTGWTGYTWSKTMRQFDDIDEGRPFPARQDRRHDFSLVGMYALSPKVDISATWVYSSGNAVTLPSGKYQIDGQSVAYYTERNGGRMPDYHRLDLGLTWNVKKTDRFESSWNFSVYNAYARENAYYISFRQKEGNPGETEAVQVSLFKIIPSVSYKFKF